MLTLKHLIFIIVMYEEEIDKLMPKDRRVSDRNNFHDLIDICR